MLALTKLTAPISGTEEVDFIFFFLDFEFSARIGDISSPVYLSIDTGSGSKM